MENPECWGASLTHNPTIGRIATQKLLRQHRNYVLKMSVNGTSTAVGLASWKLQGLCGHINP